MEVRKPTIRTSRPGRTSRQHCFKPAVCVHLGCRDYSKHSCGGQPTACVRPASRGSGDRCRALDPYCLRPSGLPSTNIPFLGAHARTIIWKSISQYAGTGTWRIWSGLFHALMWITLLKETRDEEKRAGGRWYRWFLRWKAGLVPRS